MIIFLPQLAISGDVECMLASKDLVRLPIGKVMRTRPKKFKGVHPDVVLWNFILPKEVAKIEEDSQVVMRIFSCSSP